MSAPERTARQGAGPVRKFGRPLAPGVVLHDLLLPPAVGRAMPCTLNTAVVAAGAELPRHSHPQTEIWVVAAGRGRLERGPEVFDIAEGDVVVFEPEVEHRLRNTGGTDLRLVSVYWGAVA
ncbi:cupin domain-containing protein [Kitasatospora sp. NPDC049285]|uniref:cupin domain-containing protein n=1 Tax=Kitasatospora sp. NPDC049285 TaxID=3157096 RepID=UPI003437A4E6